jgi:membrane fusion protein (multidrug efflux system)
MNQVAGRDDMVFRIDKIGMLAIAVALLTASSLLIMSGCQTSTAAESSSTEAKIQQVEHRVRVVEAVSGDVQETITRVTTISSPESVQVLPLVGGQIVELKAEEGRQVVAGQLIARLDDRQLRLAEERAAAELEKARHDEGLALRKLESAIIGREEYLNYVHASEQAQRDWQAAKLEREKAEIKAPISGVISLRHVSLGDTVFTSTPLVTITNLSKLQADILVPQDQVGKVAPGNQVILNPGGDASRIIKGVVVRVSPVVETLSGTVKVVVNIPGNQRGVMPGLFVKAHIITGVIAGVTLVPRDAIVIENAMSVIYKVSDGFARRVPVEVGFAKDDLVQVIGDIAPGERVVISGKAGINDMTRVRVAQSF